MKQHITTHNKNPSLLCKSTARSNNPHRERHFNITHLGNIKIQNVLAVQSHSHVVRGRKWQELQECWAWHGVTQDLAKVPSFAAKASQGPLKNPGKPEHW